MATLISVSRQGIMQIPRATPADFNKFQRIYKISEPCIKEKHENMTLLVWTIDHKNTDFREYNIGKSS